MPSMDSTAAGSAVMTRKAKSKSFASMASKIDGDSRRLYQLRQLAFDRKSASLRLTSVVVAALKWRRWTLTPDTEASFRTIVTDQVS